MNKEKHQETIDLFTPKDVLEVRRILYKEQNGLDKLTGLPVRFEDTHTDHSHDDEQLVRGVLYRQTNMVLGKIENLRLRYLYWYDGSLSDFLRLAADYLDQEKDTRYRHPGWIKKVKTLFKKLNAANQNAVLKELGSKSGTNLKNRLDLFSSVIMSRNHSFKTITFVLNTYLKEQDG
jgi:hypothetical protein